MPSSIINEFSLSLNNRVSRIKSISLICDNLSSSPITPLEVADERENVIFSLVI